MIGILRSIAAESIENSPAIFIDKWIASESLFEVTQIIYI